MVRRSGTPRARAAAWLAAALVLLPGSAGSSATGLTVLRIGTGGGEGTYYPVGTLIARGLSGSQDCAQSGGCGIPGLLAVAQISNGSVANVEGIAAGVLEAGLVQADVAYWAWSGTGIFAARQAHSGLRAVAALYAESIHLVVRRAAGMREVTDLAGRRVSLDEPGSGTLADARLVLEAWGLSESDLRPVYLKPAYAAERLAAGALDAFFFVGGYPIRSVTRLAATGAARLVPLAGAPARRLLERSPFLHTDTIPAGTYAGIGEVPTLSVAAQLVVDASLPENLVYRVTRALWSEHTRGLLRTGHPKGREIRLENALAGLAIPLHRGALRYYAERGLVPAAGTTR